MEHPEQYYNRDMWPPENDRPLMFRLASDVPVLQNTLIRIFVIGLSKVIIGFVFSVKAHYCYFFHA
jgi:integrator complex subunit 1